MADEIVRFLNGEPLLYEFSRISSLLWHKGTHEN